MAAGGIDGGFMYCPNGTIESGSELSSILDGREGGWFPDNLPTVSECPAFDLAVSQFQSKSRNCPAVLVPRIANNEP